MCYCGIIDFAKADLPLGSQENDFLALTLDPSMKFLLDYIVRCELRNVSHQVFCFSCTNLITYYYFFCILFYMGLFPAA